MSQSIFKNPSVSSAPALSGGAVGNGTLTIDDLTHFTITQSYTVVCTAIAPFTVFDVIASLDGPIGVATVGDQFRDGEDVREEPKIFFTIQQGPTLFDIGDTFTFAVLQGTDLNRENIDTYDELPQKNYGPGIPGTNSGDDNTRLSTAAILASLTIQSLSYQSLLADEDGNDISIQYIDGVVAAKAGLTIQDLHYAADSVGLAGNSITMEYEDWSPAIKASITIQGLLFEAVTAGSAGNAISLQYTTGAPTSTPVISVIGTVVTVQIQSGVTTHAQIKAEVNLDPVASLIVAAINNIVGTATAPVAPTSLTGGADSIGAAGSEVVTVVGTAIKVKLQGGVSTATQVKAAVDAYGPAAALVDTTITGTGSNTQTAPVSPTALSGGLDNIGAPGAEVITVVGPTITIRFQSGINTAQNIKDALDANLAVAALVSITINGSTSATQSAPVSRKYLGGGAPADTYSGNVNEITAPTTFFDGNGNFIIGSIIVQGELYVRHNSKFRRIVTLDDIDAIANGSGPTIPNAQKAINDIDSRENQDRNIKVVRGDDWAWDLPTTTLSWATDAFVQIPGLPESRNRIPAGSVSLPTDGDVAYVSLNRTAGAPATLAVSVALIGSLALTNDVYIIARRIGTKIVRSGGDGAAMEIRKDGTIVDSAAESLDFVGDGFIVTEATPGHVQIALSAVTDLGNVDIMLRPPVSTFILRSPDLTKWQVNVSNAGVLSATSGATGAVTNIKVTRPDLSEASFAITNAGELQWISPPAGGETLDDQYYIASPDGTAWHVRIETDESEVITPPDVTFYASYRSSLDADYAAGSPTGAAAGSPAAAITGSKLDLTGGAPRYVSYNAAANADSPQQGAIRFKYTPNFTGLPPVAYSFFSISQAPGNINNTIEMDLNTSGQLVLVIADQVGTLLINSVVAAWAPVAGTEYEFEINYDLDSGVTTVFLDGVLQATFPATGTRSATIANLQVGTDYSQFESQDGFISDFTVFNAVQHLSGYSLPSALFFDDSLQVSSDETAVNYARWRNDQGDVLAQLQEINGKALWYLPIFTAATLPASPPSIPGTLPMAFYDDGTVKRMVYHDGTSWQAV